MHAHIHTYKYTVFFMFIELLLKLKSQAVAFMNSFIVVAKLFTGKGLKKSTGLTFDLSQLNERYLKQIIDFLPLKILYGLSEVHPKYFTKFFLRYRLDIDIDISHILLYILQMYIYYHIL